MKKEFLIAQIKKKAKQDAKKREDPRFLDAMGFMVAKGFLRTNREIPLAPNKRLRIDDVVWAGRNVEPRILEVLPAAVLRLGRHFDLDPAKHGKLARIVRQLHRREERGDAFYGAPYQKIKAWVDLPLRDKRVKQVKDKKISKTFRLSPAALENLRNMSLEQKCNETESLERLLLSAV